MLKLITEHRPLVEQRSRELLLSRSVPKPSQAELDRGIPLLIDQLLEALRTRPVLDDEIIDAADRYAGRLFALGFTVSEVVHGYGVLCEVVTSLGAERDVWFDVRDFEIFNRVLDVAIAGAVTEYDKRRADAAGARELEDLGLPARELRNSLTAASMAFAMIRQGSVGVGGRTAEVVERSLRRMGYLLDRSLAEVRLQAAAPPAPERVGVAAVVQQIAAGLQREADARAQTLEIEIDGALELDADRQLLTSALSNLVQNGLEYSHERGHVRVRAFAHGDHVSIEVEDECGGLPDGGVDELFLPFMRRAARRAGVGLGLSIVARAAQALRGEVRLRDLPGKGCVFTLDLPRVVEMQPQPATA